MRKKHPMRLIALVTIIGMALEYLWEVLLIQLIDTPFPHSLCHH